MRRTSYLDPRVDSRATIFRRGVFSFVRAYQRVRASACSSSRIFTRTTACSTSSLHHMTVRARRDFRDAKNRKHTTPRVHPSKRSVDDTSRCSRMSALIAGETASVRNSLNCAETYLRICKNARRWKRERKTTPSESVLFESDEKRRRCISLSALDSLVSLTS